MQNKIAYHKVKVTHFKIIEQLNEILLTNTTDKPVFLNQNDLLAYSFKNVITADTL
jgi:hypothetical protein